MRQRVSGEHRLLGLWTSTAYNGSPRDIPVLRRKVDGVIEHFGLDPASHDGKAALNALETYPRDELFQASADDLIGWQVNHGYDRAPDFFPASQFQQRFNRRDVIARVLDTLDVRRRPTISESG